MNLYARNSNWVHKLSIRNVCQTHRKSSNKCWVVWIVNSSEPGSLSVFKLSDILLTRSIFCHFSVTMWRTSFPIPHISVSIWKPLISELSIYVQCYQISVLPTLIISLQFSNYEKLQDTIISEMNNVHVKICHNCILIIWLMQLVGIRQNYLIYHIGGKK